MYCCLGLSSGGGTFKRPTSACFCKRPCCTKSKPPLFLLLRPRAGRLPSKGSKKLRQMTQLSAHLRQHGYMVYEAMQVLVRCFMSEVWSAVMHSLLS